MEELAAWLTLARTPGIHAGSLRQLLEHHTSAASIVRATPAELAARGAARTTIDWLQTHREDSLAAELRWLEADAHHFVPLGDSRYPPLLAQIGDAPVALYVRGDPTVLSLPQLAVVGSRNPTPQGRENARTFAAHLARCGLAITSGLATGIDAAAHTGALEGGGKTVAVCGTGLDVAYPRGHAMLADAIAAGGALVSEFGLGVAAVKSNFPRRNRIISALSLGTLVVEAALRSGSLITARLAAEQGREVFAIPGSIHNPLAHGCHLLLRHGAKLVENGADIFAELRSLVGALSAVSFGAERAARAANSGPAL